MGTPPESARTVQLSVARFGGFEVDLRNGVLSRNGTRNRLLGQPLQLLELLLQEPGQTVTREQIQRHLWPDGTVVEFEHSVNATVKRLREALGDDAEHPTFIETIPRRGYRFIAPVESTPRAASVAIEARLPPVLLFEPPAQAGSGSAVLGREEKAVSVRLRVLLGGVAVLALLTVVLVRSRGIPKGTAQPAINSLAVLPLQNLSHGPGQQYFVDGLTDELTTDLARLENLRVISHNSAMLYTDSHKTLPQIARELNVDAVVTGSVERSGNRVRVRTKLLRAGTNEVLWAESYDRDLSDVLRLEAEVSQAIAHQVGIRLTPQMQSRLENKPRTNPQAREAYFRARYFFDKDDRDSTVKCLQYFQEAIAADPNYAPAYAGLARCYDLAYYFDLFSWAEATSRKKAAALKAIELDDELSEGHSELADYYLAVAWDFSAAEREYKRALELDPNSSHAYENYAYYLRDVGRTGKALQAARRAHELDPLSLYLADFEGWMLLYSRGYDEAASQFRSVLEINPNYRRSRWGLARVYELKGMYSEALSECRKIPVLPNIDAFTKALFEKRCSLYEKVYSSSGAQHINRNWSESALQEIRDYMSLSGGDMYFIAGLYAASGEDGKALDLLEQLYVKRDNDMLQLKVDPRMDNLRSSARLQDLLRRMNFPEE